MTEHLNRLRRFLFHLPARALLSSQSRYPHICDPVLTGSAVLCSVNNTTETMDRLLKAEMHILLLILEHHRVLFPQGY